MLAVGLRNPWRFSFMPDGQIVIADVGQNQYEEINVGLGANYGWPCREGLHDFLSDPGCDDVDTHDPVLEKTHSGQGFCSITGGYVVRDPGLPTLAGRYIYGDFCNDALRSVVLPSGTGDAAGRRERARPELVRRGRLRADPRRVAGGPVSRMVDGAPTPCGDADTDRPRRPDADAIADATADPDADADPNADTHADANPNANADADTNANANPNANADADTHADANANADADPHTDANAKPNADTHANADAHRDGDAVPNADAERRPCRPPPRRARRATPTADRDADPDADAVDRHPDPDANRHAGSASRRGAGAHAEPAGRDRGRWIGGRARSSSASPGSPRSSGAAISASRCAPTRRAARRSARPDSGP